jgi:hypothetical protein
VKRLVAPALLWLAFVAIAATGLIIRGLHADPDLGHELSFRLVQLVFATSGAVLAAARPRNLIGWLLSIIPVLDAVDRLASATAQHLPHLIAASIPLALAMALSSGVGVLIFAIVTLLLLTFPDGRLPSPRWRPVAIGVTALVIASAAIMVLASGPIHSDVPDVVKPFGVDALEPLVPFVGFLSFLGGGVAGFALGAASLVHRYRSGGFIQRQQLKWMAASASLLALTVLLYFVTNTLEAFFPSALDWGSIDTVGDAVFTVVVLSLPLAVSVAVLRYRLYDIDVLINRGLVYGGTTLGIGVAFFGGIIALQALLSSVTAGSELPVAASTLISFALFQPIRRRIQDAVDRRFDRSRYDAARMLEAFADRLRDEVDLDALRGELLGAVRTTMAPTHASLWLRERVS